MQQYLFEYKATYTKNHYIIDYDDNEKTLEIDFCGGIRLVKAKSYIEAYNIMETSIKLMYDLNDKDRFDISITDLNI